MSRTTVMAVLALTAATAAAQSRAPERVLLESHAGARPADVGEYVAAVCAGLGSPPPLHGAELAALIDERVSRWPGTPDYPLVGLVRTTVIDAQEDVVRGRFTEAVARLDRLRATVAQQSAAVAVDPTVRRSLFAGTLALLKSLVRLRRQGEAESLAVELQRSFPDFPVSEREHGPEVAEFVASVRRHNWPRATHTISIETVPASAAIFVNERYVGTSPVKVLDALPGRYRVMARVGAQQSRVHTVSVLEAAVAVRLDLTFDRALGEHGLQFRDDAERARLEPAFALRVARSLGAAEIIAVGMAGPAERPLFTATVYNVETGGVLRSASVAVGPLPPPRSLIVALGRFLRAGQVAEGIIVQQDRAPVFRAATQDRPARRSVALRVLSFLSLAAGAAAAGTGGYLLHLDGRGTCTLRPGQLVCPNVYHTVPGGAALVGVGAAAVAAGVTMLVVDWRRRRVRVGLSPGGPRAPTLVWVAGSI